MKKEILKEYKKYLELLDNQDNKNINKKLNKIEDKIYNKNVNKTLKKR